MTAFRRLTLILSAVLIAASLQAKELTGFLTGSSGGLSPGIYKMAIGQSGSLAQLAPYSYSLFGGAYAGNNNYWCMLGYDPSGNIMAGLFSIDPTTGQVNRNNTAPNWGCTDLTYDFTTDDMYGVLYMRNGYAMQHELVKITMPNGDVTSIAKLPGKFQAIACDLWGNMYAMSSAGVLYSVNQNTGEVKQIGSTGIVASTDQVQSMEFDRDSGELYWSFLDTDENAFIAKINPATGEVLSKQPTDKNALLGALYIPFKEVTSVAPNQITDFYASTEDNSVSFTWKAPTITVGGEALQGNMRIEIRRGGVVVKEFENVAPGASGQWTDSDTPEEGDLHYAFSCYQGENRGTPIFHTTHIGPDVPAAVSNVAATAEGNNVKLSWEAPTTDKNGKPLDPATLTYRVTRTPADKTWTDLTSTSLVDTEIPQYGSYTYTVYALNSLGESAGTASSPLTVGPAITMPWYPDLTDASVCDQFSVYNLDNDDYYWYPTNGTFKMTTMSFTPPCDDWLITPPLHLETGVTYKLKYSLKASQWADENLRLTLGTTTAPESQTRTIDEVSHFAETNHDYEQTITVDATGDYTLGFHCSSDGGWMSDALAVGNISIEPIGAVDLAVSSISGNTDLTVGKAEEFTVEIYNNGTEAQQGFALSLLSDEGEQLASANYTDEIAPGATSTVKISWTPLNARAESIRARVSKDNDVNTVNDLSSHLSLRFVNPSDAIISAGIHDSDPNLLPFSFEDLYSYAQSVYNASELDIDGGMIKEISWRYNNTGAALNDKDVKVYMANTAMPYNTTTFATEAERVLVFDGKVSFLPGENMLRITLDTPFPYAGGNLLVYTEKINDTETGATVKFEAQNFPDTPRTLLSYNSNGVLDPARAYVSSMLPCITLVLNTDGGGKLHGSITSGGTGVKGVKVALAGTTTATTTDISGHYQFGYLPEGTYDITATPDHYSLLPAGGHASVAVGADTSVDIVLPARPSASMSGTVTDKQGNPVAGAAVVVTGWEKTNATTDAEGSYTIARIYQHDAMRLDVYAPGYRHYTLTAPFTAEGATDKDLTIEALHNPVTEAAAIGKTQTAEIIWQPVDFGYEQASDNGTPHMAVESPTYGVYLFGKRFDGPLALYNVTWHSSISSETPVDNVDLYVYALTEEGAPSQVLFSAEDCLNIEDAWNEYIFDTPVIAPYGCIIALTGKETICLSQDNQQIPGSYIIDLQGNAYAPLTDDNGNINLMIRTRAAFFNAQTGYTTPDVTYNIYRIDETENEATIYTDYAGQPSVFDPDWSTIEPGRYSYAIEAVYPDGFHAERFVTNRVTNNNVGIDAIIMNEDGCSYYDLYGQPVVNPVKGQILIRVKDGKAAKIRF